jgi:hypothetical protein
MALPKIDQEAAELLARHELGLLRGQDLVDWAVRLLEQDRESPALVALAGADLDGRPLLEECLPLFRAALAEAHAAVPADRDGLLRLHLRTLARLVLSGTLAPEEALGRAEAEVLAPLRHPQDLMAWCYLGSARDPVTFAELSPPEVEALTRKLATEVAAGA